MWNRHLYSPDTEDAVHCEFVHSFNNCAFIHHNTAKANLGIFFKIRQDSGRREPGQGECKSWMMESCSNAVATCGLKLFQNYFRDYYSQ